MTSRNDNLDKLISNLENVNGTNETPLEELFNSLFMKEHSKYNNVISFLKDGNFNPANLDNEDESKLNDYINTKTDFSSWNDFANEAAKKWLSNELNK